ncbi:MAG: hypothetical protein KatS3mg115_0545 [Candidatus Poribacteria bacterium]|nr:MAG: hypothetical protein KatS3mg115_0545 [Candidatus Poribacteria bacterium]
MICVFGCGGDRDRAKRPIMGRIAAELADLVILTSDNPRTEDPIRILQEIEEGIPNGTSYLVIPDREEAIRHAVGKSPGGRPDPHRWKGPRGLSDRWGPTIAL